MRQIKRSELARMDGFRGARKYVAWNGLVFDVSDCPKWWAERHEDLHFPGQDLTEEIAAAPHGEEVFDYPCVILVGILLDE